VLVAALDVDVLPNLKIVCKRDAGRIPAVRQEAVAEKLRFLRNLRIQRTNLRELEPRAVGKQFGL
jgi:hypothetical protein